MPYLSHRKIGRPNDVEKTEGTKRRNIKWLKYYGDKRWKLLRNYIMSKGPLCVDCLFEGRSVPAEEAHHKIPFSWFDTEEDRFKALLYEPFIVPLCKAHHLERHKHLEKPDNFEQTNEYKTIHNFDDIY